MDDKSLLIFYAVYLGGCAFLIAFLGRLLHRSGSDILQDAFGPNTPLARSVTRLLDVGFYLMSLGYVGATFMPFGTSSNYGWMIEMALQKLGWFLLLLGPVHLFNLLLLALFRRRCDKTVNPASA